MAKTKTMKELFGEILAIKEVEANEELRTFIQSRIDLLDKKNASRGQTATQKENETLKTKILTELKIIDRAVTVTELIKTSEELGEYSNQKLSALLNAMVKENLIIKTIDKKKSYFSIADWIKEG